MSENARPWLLSIKDAPREKSANDAGDATETETSEDQPGSPPPHLADESGDDSPVSLPDDTLGLALSGGGIRSASFSLGVIQSLARQDWLRHVDFLSTVSGGGYTGSFLGRFFDQTVKTDGIAGSFGDVADGAAQDRVKQELTDSSSRVIHWLRSHANYLSPTGLGESLFNFATFWRNFLSIFFVLGVFFFALFGAVNALTYNGFLNEIMGAKSEFVSGITPLQSWLPDWSRTPWTAIVELIFWLAIIPLAFAYWLASQDHYRRFVVSFLFVCLLVAVAGLIGSMQPVAIAIFAAAIAWTYWGWIAIDKREGHGNFDRPWRMALARNHLTHRLVYWVSAAVLLAAFAAIDGFGIRLAREHLLGQLTLATIVACVSSLAGLATLAAPVLRVIGTIFADESQTSGLLKAVTSVPYLPTLMVLLFAGFLPLVIISFLGHLAYEIGHAYLFGLAATVVAVLVTLLLGGKSAMPFVNRSGPLTVYAARLARVFLGAVNPNRLRRDDGLDVSHVIEGDDVQLDRYAPHAAGGPLHLINVAVNQTVDVASRRGLRERHAENMAVGPAGINLCSDWHGTWVESENFAGRLKPISDQGDLPHPFVSTTGDAVALEPLGLRKWMGISGAAVSPGLGRRTSGVVSLVATLANARLGYWWDSGLRVDQRKEVAHRLSLFDRIALVLQRFLQAQSLLVKELRGRFPGPWGRYWYLSDGGHFENSGVYELLRRRVPYIVLCGAGQDLQQRASDIAELTRIARIDFGAEIRDARKLHPEGLSSLGVPSNVQDSIGSLEEVLAPDGGNSGKHAALFRVDFGSRNDASSWNHRSVCWILYLKASLTGDESSDVLNYAKNHPNFPNETTLDQFFDEAQWESYRRLGEHIGTELFQ